MLTSQQTRWRAEANGRVPNLPASVAKTRQVRRPPSCGIETLPKNEPRPSLALELEDALGLAGLAGNPGAQRLTPATPLFPLLGPCQPLASPPRGCEPRQPA